MTCQHRNQQELEACADCRPWLDPICEGSFDGKTWIKIDRPQAFGYRYTRTRPNPSVAKCIHCGTRTNDGAKCCGEELRRRNDQLIDNIFKLQAELRELKEPTIRVGGHHPKCARVPHFCGDQCCKQEVELRATIAGLEGDLMTESNRRTAASALAQQRKERAERLELELAKANDYALDFKRTVERLTYERENAWAERNNAQAELAHARSVCMSGWGCILSKGHAGQCRDVQGNNHGTPGQGTR